MPAKDLGAKHLCFKCGTKFYDLKKPVAICPKCGANQRDMPVVKSPPAEKRSRTSKVVEPAVADEVEVAETDEDVEADEDAEVEDEAASDDEG